MLILASVIASQALQCRVVRDQIRITLSTEVTPEMKYLAVVHRGRWSAIVDDRHRLAPFPRSGRQLTIPLRTQSAVEDRDGKETLVRAFPRPGAYRLVFTDNLETEETEMLSNSCTVRVTARSLRR